MQCSIPAVDSALDAVVPLTFVFRRELQKQNKESLPEKPRPDLKAKNAKEANA